MKNLIKGLFAFFAILFTCILLPEVCSADTLPVSIQAGAVHNNRFLVEICVEAETQMQAFSFLVKYNSGVLKIVSDTKKGYDFTDAFSSYYRTQTGSMLMSNDIDEGENSRVRFVGVQEDAEHAASSTHSVVCYVEFGFQNNVIDEDLQNSIISGIRLNVEQLQGQDGDPAMEDRDRYGNISIILPKQEGNNTGTNLTESYVQEYNRQSENRKQMQEAGGSSDSKQVTGQTQDGLNPDSYTDSQNTPADLKNEPNTDSSDLGASILTEPGLAVQDTSEVAKEENKPSGKKDGTQKIWITAIGIVVLALAGFFIYTTYGKRRKSISSDLKNNKKLEEKDEKD